MRQRYDENLQYQSAVKLAVKLRRADETVRYATSHNAVVRLFREKVRNGPLLVLFAIGVRIYNVFFILV
jgi:hypothetical protein